MGIQTQKKEIRSISLTLRKINSKWVKGFNETPESLGLLEENVEVILFHRQGHCEKDSSSAGNHPWNRQMGLHESKSSTKQKKHQNEETAYRMVENLC